MKQTLSTLIATVGLLGMLQSCVNLEGEVKTETQLPDSNTVAEEVAGSQPADPLAEFDMKKANRLTDTAKLLAGMPVDKGSELINIQNASAWQVHRNALENSWQQLETQQLSKVRKWSERELQEINNSSYQVFYPFSGPDFLYAYSLFPQAEEYVMVGLEPIGTVPDFAQSSAVKVSQQLTDVKNSLYAILKFSFFRTNDMKEDMAAQGVLPVIFTFIARTNNKILDVEFVGINQGGKIEKMAQGMVPGVKIAFLPQGEKNPRTLYYFSTDLSNGGLTKNPQFNNFVKNRRSPVTYLKAASYLMYYGSFSTVKDTILSQSSHVLQDDSGMPLKSFAQDQWQLKFYGNYTQPIALFSNRYQPDLRKVYQTDKTIKPLDFGIGYKFGVNESNLMLAMRKPTTAASLQ
jgi:hypothetical protein